MPNDQGKGSIEERIANYHAPEVDGGKQPEAKPTSKPTEVVSQDSKVEKEPEKVQSNPEELEEKEALANSKNPERTKAYIDKLKEKLRQVTTPKVPEKSEEPVGSPFDIFHPEDKVRGQQPQTQQVQIPQGPQVQTPYLNPLQVQNLKNQFVREDGTVDIDGLNQALAKANYDAYQARLASQSLKERLERFEQRQEEHEAYAKHPEIDPQNKDKFDKRIYKLVVDRLLRNRFEGRQQTLENVTSDIKNEIGFQPKVDVEAEKIQAVEQYKETQRARQQGPFEAGRGQPRLDSASLEDLRKMSRRHGPQADAAISQRLKNLGI